MLKNGCSIIAIVSSLQFLGSLAFADDHQDVLLNYYTCGGGALVPASVTWNSGPGVSDTNNTFVHKENGVEHTDNKIIYATWDGSCWQANWDSQKIQFYHQMYPSGANGHFDRVINYLTWGMTKWSATRQGFAWYHHGPLP
jgi:hypothetical protein